ncbi:Tyrosinase [Zancudomyces culisetae]|uniref:Tyrosinase n=1 Tax=Zancudomyces culisetae TaxID=1213189 RepID=A0A1R1PH42_ZANCU|nr:Tyrosinase [Zancudomyces culisetae]|eukprot:OMH80296.1 Tyrosinase [Zancudomyces culisetae]
MKMNLKKRLVLELLNLFNLANSQDPNTPCSRLTVRKEIRDVSPDEWNMIKRVVVRLQENGYIEKYARAHTDIFDYYHGGAFFLPYHRMLTRRFEQDGQQFDSNFFVPYWDAARDFSNPVSSILFTDDYIGRDGDPSRGDCVQAGFMKDMQFSYPYNHCLKRKLNGPGSTINSWYPPEVITSMMQTSRNYESLRNSLEYTLHGAVHLGLGGEMISKESPNDFAFYLHHSNMDRIWWKWQNMDPKNLMDYGGSNPAGQPNGSLNDMMRGFDRRVGDVMRVGYGEMCYTYPDVVPLERIRSLFDTKNDTISSGSSVQKRTYGEENVEKLRSLNIEALRSIFPKLLTNETNPNMFDLPPANSALSRAACISSNSEDCSDEDGNTNKKMPLPFPPTEMFIKMHKLDRSVVMDTFEKYRKVVVQLNEAGYVSPYL